MVPWGEFVPRMRWDIGEHVALVGPTGAGKTNLAFWLLPQRQYVTILATKPEDPSLTAFGKTHGFKRFDTWQSVSPRRVPRRIIWPRERHLRKMVTAQHAAFVPTMDSIFMMGKWTLYVDELWWLCVQLKMVQDVKVMLQQARSLKISFVAATQRPAWVPLEVYDQSSHLFFWRDNDETNLKRLSGISYVNAREVRQIIATLPKYHVLYINTRDEGKMMVTRPPAPTQKGKQ